VNKSPSLALRPSLMQQSVCDVRPKQEEGQSRKPTEKALALRPGYLIVVS